MLLIVYFVSFLLPWHQTGAAVTEFKSTPSDTKIAIETNNLTLTWSYTLGGSVLVGRIFNITGGIQEAIARREINGPTDVVGNYLSQGRFLANISNTQAWLKILQVQRSDRGRYAFDMAVSGNQNLRHEVELIIHAPAVFNNFSSDKVLREGSHLRLFCEASGIPTPNITWVKVSASGSENDVLHWQSTWDFGNITRNEAGTYRCTANNGVENPVHHTLEVTVQFSPEITLQKTYFVGRGKSVSLHCQVEGSPLPSITWTPCNPQENACDRSMLNISKAQNNGVYTCTAKNSLGNDTASTNLVIGGKMAGIELTITNTECKENDQSFWPKLQETVKKIFQKNSDFLKVSLIEHSCGSLVVKLAFEFKTAVSEALVVETLRNTAKSNNFGEFAVNASSIQGIAVAENTSTPPTDKTTGRSSDDDKLPIILAVVIPIAGLAIIAGGVAFCMWKKKKDKEVGDKNTGGQQMNQIQGGHGNNGYSNTHSSSASPEKTADITYAVVEQGNSMPRTAPKKPLRTYETEILVEGNGSGYEVAGSSSRRPEEPPGKKPKKQKKGQEPDKPVGVVYAQVDKSKQKSKASQNTYDQSERPKSKQPGELTYAELDHGQGSSMPRNSAAPTKKPQPYVETEYAMIV